jgi:hypothetical protein
LARNTFGVVNDPVSYASISTVSPSGGTMLNAQRMRARVMKREFSARCNPGQIRRPAPKEK